MTTDTTFSDRFFRFCTFLTLGLIIMTVASFFTLAITFIWQGHWVYPTSPPALACLEARTGLHQCYSLDHENHGAYWARTQELIWKTFLTALVVTFLIGISTGIWAWARGA